MSLSIEGYVEVEAGLFSPGVLEDAFRRFLTGTAKLTYGRRPYAELGRVTKISGRGDRVIIAATIDTQAPRTEMRDIENKVRSGTIRSLGIDGEFSAAHATITSFYIAPVAGVPGTGFITDVEPS